MFVNSFTRMLLNANPKGDNQYKNPDGPSRRSVTPSRILPRLADYRDVGSNADDMADYFGGWILPSGDLIDAPETHGETILEAPTDFGIRDKVAKLRDRLYKKGQYDRIDKLSSAAVKRAVSTGSIRLGIKPDGSEVAVSAGPRTSIDQVLEAIYSKKIPKSKIYYLDTPDYKGTATFGELSASRSFKQLARFKEAYRT